MAKAGDVCPDAVLQTMREPVLVLDAKFRIRAASTFFYDLIQVRARDVLGIFVFDLGEAWNVPQLHELLESVLQDDADIFDYALELGSKSLLVNSCKLIDEESGEESILLCMQDVTAMKQAEKEFQQFVYTVSHDLQQPLSKMITLSELILEKMSTVDSVDKSYLDMMYKAGKNMKSFIDNLTHESASALKAIQWTTARKK